MNELVQITRYPRSEYNDLITEMNTAHRSRLLKEQMLLADASPYRKTSVTARSKLAVPECTSCGVCCSLPMVVFVPRGNEERLSAYWDITVEDVVVERVIGRDLETGRCVNLEGTLGDSIGCSIYEDRPNICRVFDAGSDRCHEYRRMYGIEPQLTDDELEHDMRMMKSRPTGLISDCWIDLKYKSVSMEFAEDGSGEIITTTAKTMCVTVALDRNRDECFELYKYDATKEEWHESQFVGISLDEAQQKITERVQRG